MTTMQVFSQKNKSTISGVVLITNQLPGEAVSVALKGTAYATLTNNKGEYKLNAEPGDYILAITYVGYKTSYTAITLLKGGKVVPNITMQEDMAALKEVAVTGKSKVQRVREQAYNITAVDLKKTYNTSADLNQILNKTTGVRVRESGGMGSDFNFTLNGFSGDQVKFFLDGVPMESFGSSLTLNNIPVNMAERIDVYKGVVPIELGSDALGGAVNIITNKSVDRYIDASYSFGSFNTHRMAVNTRFTNKSGLILNLNAFGNYSDNDYKVDVSIADKATGSYLPEKKYRHFNDGYKSGAIMAETGFKNKSFADYLLVGFVMSGNKKEIQQGISMDKVAGQAFKDGEAFISSLKYKKNNLFTKGLSVNFNTTYSLVNNRTIDTSSRVYDWAGNYTYRSFGGASDKGELNDNKKTFYLYDEKNLLTITNIKYEIDEHQSIAFNHTYTSYKRKEKEGYINTIDLGEPSFDKNVLGLVYNVSGFDNRFSASVFGKMFDFRSSSVIKGKKESTSSTNYGYGVTATYHLTENIQTKASYEHAYRLPSPAEMYGDSGVTITSNTGLIPESSDNVNFGLVLIAQKNKHHFGAESSLIYRNAKDFIQMVPVGNTSSYKNLQSVRVTGIDGVIRYAYDDFLSFEVNATYQKQVNTNKFVKKDNLEVPDALYNAQLPNVPIFFGNADLAFSFKNIKYKHDRLTLNVSANYLDAFYLTWPVLGELVTKKAIPEQFTQNAMVSYSFLNGKYNFAFECRNITDVKVYDYFKVQKPGRAFSVKLRYFIQ